MIRPMRPEEAHACYRILEASFPTDERRPFAAQKKLLSERAHHPLVHEGVGGVDAVLSIWALDGFTYIEHFAVDSLRRNQGLGGRVLRAFLRMPGHPRVVFEVEPPETELSKRRIAFYERNGFVLNPYPYFQRPLAPGQKPVRLMLMSEKRPLTPLDYLKFCRELNKTVWKKR